VMIKNSTNINKQPLSPQINENKTVTYDIEYSGLGLGQAHKCGGIKLINRIPTIPS